MVLDHPFILFTLNILWRCVKIAEDLRVNNQIRSKKIRLIDSNGDQIGIMSLNEAKRKAENRDLDLVEVAPQANPSVCRIMDYGKYKYEQAKKAKEAKKNQNVMNVKEVQMGVKIEEHDFNVKLKQARRFLNDKDKVKVRIKFRGREMMHKELGYDLCERLIEGTKELGSVSKKPTMEGRNMMMFITPDSDK